MTGRRPLVLWLVLAAAVRCERDDELPPSRPAVWDHAHGGRLQPRAQRRADLPGSDVPDAEDALSEFNMRVAMGVMGAAGEAHAVVPAWRRDPVATGPMCISRKEVYSALALYLSFYGIVAGLHWCPALLGDMARALAAAALKICAHAPHGAWWLYFLFFLRAVQRGDSQWSLLKKLDAACLWIVLNALLTVVYSILLRDIGRRTRGSLAVPASRDTEGAIVLLSFLMAGTGLGFSMLMHDVSMSHLERSSDEE